MKPENPNEENKKLEAELVETSNDVDDTSTSSVPEEENEKDLIPLSAEAFIKAMQGETVVDENGVERCFLVKGKRGRRVVVIEHVIVKQDIIITKNEELYFHYQISIHSGDFREYFGILGGSFTKTFTIWGGYFRSDFEIGGGDFLRIVSVYGGNFYGVFSFYGGVFQNNVWISGGVFQRGFWIKSGKFKRTFHISGGNFQKEFLVRNSDGQINKFCLAKSLTFDLTIEPKSNINQFYLNGNIEKDAILQINDISLNKLVIDNCKNFGFAILTDVKFQPKKIYEKNDENKKWELTNETVSSEINITGSFLGNTKFQSVHFKSADKIIIDKTDISEASIRGEYFPMPVTKVFSDSEGNRTKNRLADFYNSLANMMKRQGNKRMELNYIATYQKLLHQSISFKKDFIDYVPLTFSFFSSNYSTSWVRALVFTIFAPLLFYVPYVLFTLECKFYLTCLAWKGILGPTQNYLDFAVPNFFKMTFNEPTFGALLMSIFGKIVFAYGVYQFIQAFRRLGRR